jgi:hypothetical protein
MMKLGSFLWFLGSGEAEDGTVGRRVDAQWRFEPVKESGPDTAADTVLLPPEVGVSTRGRVLFPVSPADASARGRFADGHVSETARPACPS